MLTADYLTSTWRPSSTTQSWDLMRLPSLATQPDSWSDTDQLGYAAEVGDVEAVERLLAQGVSVNSYSLSGNKPLNLAVKKGHVKVAELLIAKGANIDGVKNTNGEGSYLRTPLLVALHSGQEDAAALLLSKGANPNTRDQVFGWTSLRLAAEAGLVRVVKALLDAGADINAKDKAGSTPLQTALAAGHDDVAGLLRDRDADLDVFTAAGLGDLDRLGKFLEAKPTSVQSHGAHGLTPLHFARTPDAAALLLAHGADANSRDNTGQTPLHAAAKRGAAEVAAALLIAARKADVNARDQAGETPLHVAAQRGATDVAEILIRNGAEVNAVSSRGTTPLGLAMRLGHKDTAELLRRHGRLAPASATQPTTSQP